MVTDELESRQSAPAGRSDRRLAVVCTALVTTLLSAVMWSWASGNLLAAPVVKKPLGASPSLDARVTMPAHSIESQAHSSGRPSSAPTPALLVGRDIMPGTYLTKGNDHCNWARLRGTSAAPYEIILAEEFEGDRSITIQPTDIAFYAVGCQALGRVAAPPRSRMASHQSFTP
jgi:hypothetical protein